MTVNPGGAGSRGSHGTRRPSLCALIGTSRSRTCHAMRTQIAADLLQSGELKFDQLGGAVSSTTASHRAAHVRSHPASQPAGIRRQLPTSGRLLAKTDHTFGKSRRDGGIRTRGLLLSNQLHPDAGHSLVSPGVASTWDDARCASPNVAQCLRTLAPTRSRHVRTIGEPCGSIHQPWRRSTKP